MKVGLSLVLLVLAVAVIALICGERASLPVTMPAPETQIEAPAPDAVRAPPEAVARARVEAPAAAPVSSAAGSPRIARLRVVDADGRGVADAVLRISPAVTWLNEDAPFRELHTDAEGRAAATIGGERVIARAHKDGVGRSGALYLHGSWVTEREIELIVQMPSVLDGVVLGANREPVAGATVFAKVQDSAAYAWGEAEPPDPVPTGVDGGFRFELQRDAVYELYAERDGVRTFDASVVARSEELPELVLAFPGALTLAGTVVDTAGTPVPGAKVSVWREYQPRKRFPARDEFEEAHARTEADGSFTIPVRRAARYRACATADGHAASDLVWLETTEASPHVEARLVLQRFAEIHGRVVHADGSPFAEVRVSAKAESGDEPDPSAVLIREERFGAVLATRSDARGDFVLAVHPSTAWTVFAYPVPDNPSVHVARAGIAPGSAHIELRVSDAERAGCIVHGTVVRADGAPVGRCAVRIIEYRDGKRDASRPADAAFDGARFTCPPLALGTQLGVEVVAVAVHDQLLPEMSPLAPAFTGPFRAEDAHLEVTLRLEPWGQLPVRVLEADGTPARRAGVNLRCELTGAFDGARVDPEGRAQLARCVPGKSRLTVYRDDDVLHEEEVTIAPRANPEIILRLPDPTNHR